MITDLVIAKLRLEPRSPDFRLNRSKNDVPWDGSMITKGRGMTRRRWEGDVLMRTDTLT
jgi:hypothetical protein